MRPALDGVLAVELGGRPAVSACGSLLAELGADVVLVEDATPPDGRAARAAGKLSVLAGVVDLERLLAVADVVLLGSDESPRDADIWTRPRAVSQVLCDITAFGHTGPLAGRPATEPLVQGWSGSAAVTGNPDGPPAFTGAPLLDMESGVYAAAAVVAALRVRREHGQGQRIDIAVYDVGVNALAAWIPLPLSGQPATRSGNRHPILAPWNVYRAADGWITLCAPTDDQWRRLCQVMETDALVDDPRFISSFARLGNAVAIDAVIEDWTRHRTAAECLDALAAAGLPSGPIRDVEDLAAEPNLRHRQSLRRALDPLTGREIMLPAPVVRLGRGERAAVVPAPGEGCDEVHRLMAGRRPAAAVAGPSTGLDDVRPLAGVRVVEIGMNTVAPLAGRQLAALGADVIKIEPPRGDANRVNGPFRNDGESYIFAISNADKRGLVLDLRDPDDQQTARRLLSGADVLVENLKPGSLDRLGFGAAEARAQWPRLIYCSANGFGHDSAYPGRPALDTVVQAMSGVMSTNVVNGVPTKSGISVADQLGGQFALLAILAALELRDATGETSTIDLAMLDAAAWATHPLWNRAATRPRVLPAADGFIVTDSPDVSVSAELTRAQAVDVIGPRVAPVLSIEEVLDHPQTTARGLLLERPDPDGRSWRLLGSPLKLESTPARVRSAMPRLGVVDPALAEEFPERLRGSAEPLSGRT